MINLLAMIISLIYLGLFSEIASYLITLGLSFIGLSYVILYVGAVSILFLFILMLIYIKIRRGEYISHVVSRCFSRLKCTLMSFERNYKVSAFSLASPGQITTWIPWKKISFIETNFKKGCLIPLKGLKGNEINLIKTYRLISTNKVQKTLASYKIQNVYSIGQIKPWNVISFTDDEGFFIGKFSTLNSPKYRRDDIKSFPAGGVGPPADGSNLNNHSLLIKDKSHLNPGFVTGLSDA